MPGESIYSDNRLAQPDEVWNFGLGDGLEKAFALMNYMRSVDGNHPINFETNDSEVIVVQQDKTYRFPSVKNHRKRILITENAIEEM